MVALERALQAADSDSSSSANGLALYGTAKVRSCLTAPATRRLVTEGLAACQLLCSELCCVLALRASCASATTKAAGAAVQNAAWAVPLKISETSRRCAGVSGGGGSV